ncbi:hypothetical protein JTB14_029574 [Gonioctena quinquepunctata]|nr:hypothetical protein JTB14_029574 [Gonioctena quinquepunctata]
MVQGYDCVMVLNHLYHPQSNPTERINRVLRTMFRSYVGDNHRNWYANLAELGFALRTAVHEVTGYTPAYHNFGRELNLSGRPAREVDPPPGAPVFDVEARRPLAEHVMGSEKVQDDVKARLNNAYGKSAVRYNLRGRPIAFCMGDTIMVRHHVLSDAPNYFATKLAPKFLKSRVRQKISNNVYRLESYEGKKLFVI